MVVPKTSVWRLAALRVRPLLHAEVGWPVKANKEVHPNCTFELLMHGGVLLSLAPCFWGKPPTAQNNKTYDTCSRWTRSAKLRSSWKSWLAVLQGKTTSNNASHILVQASNHTPAMRHLAAKTCLETKNLLVFTRPQTPNELVKTTFTTAAGNFCGKATVAKWSGHVSWSTVLISVPVHHHLKVWPSPHRGFEMPPVWHVKIFAPSVGNNSQAGKQNGSFNLLLTKLAAALWSFHQFPNYIDA